MICLKVEVLTDLVIAMESDGLIVFFNSFAVSGLKLYFQITNNLTKDYNKTSFNPP